MSTPQAPNVFEVLGKSMAYLVFIFVAMPLFFVFFGALGGFVVQTACGPTMVAGALQLGLKLDPSHLWQLSAFLAWIGVYLRTPAPSKDLKS
jgi:hypothetical protein